MGQPLPPVETPKRDYPPPPAGGGGDENGATPAVGGAKRNHAGRRKMDVFWITTSGIKGFSSMAHRLDTDDIHDNTGRLDFHP